MKDPIERRDAIDAVLKLTYADGAYGYADAKDLVDSLENLPSAQINCIVNNDIHLCDSCKYSYPSCPSSKFDVVFGDSVGHDNICACNKYQPRYDEEWRKLHYESSYSQGFLEGVRMCEQAQPKQKLGKWVDDGDPLSWVCSECGYRVARYNNTPYCPNCGVKMINARGEQDE